MLAEPVLGAAANKVKRREVLIQDIVRSQQSTKSGWDYWISTITEKSLEDFVNFRKVLNVIFKNKPFRTLQYV